jgi:hypothetical protein
MLKAEAGKSKLFKIYADYVLSGEIPSTQPASEDTTTAPAK